MFTFALFTICAVCKQQAQSKFVAEAKVKSPRKKAEAVVVEAATAPTEVVATTTAEAATINEGSAEELKQFYDAVLANIDSVVVKAGAKVPTTYFLFTGIGRPMIKEKHPSLAGTQIVSVTP